jgi:N-acetylmuramoyl-L-alanine amidase CwlA
MIKRLTIENGIIQDKYLDGVPIYVEIIKPSGKHNVRTEKPMTPLSTTTHNTGNSAPSANAKAHGEWLQDVEDNDSKYVGAAIFVDCNSIRQVLPLNEVAYHAGTTQGNTTSIGIEICEVGDYPAAQVIGQKLVASLNITYGFSTTHKHQDWNDKYCPRLILDQLNGWSLYVQGVVEYMRLIKSYESIPDWGKEAWEWAYYNGLNDGFVQNVYEIQHMVVLHRYHLKFIQK